MRAALANEFHFLVRLELAEKFRENEGKLEHESYVKLGYYLYYLDFCSSANNLNQKYPYTFSLPRLRTP